MIQELDVRPGDFPPLWPELLSARNSQEVVREARRIFGGVLVSVVHLDAGTVVDREAHDHELTGQIFVGLLLAGALRIRQDGAEATVAQGDLVSLDGSRPHRLVVHEPSAVIVVHAEHHRLGLVAERTRGLTAIPWSGSSGVYALAASTLASIARNLDALLDSDGNALGLMITDLLSCLFADQLQTRSATPASGRQALTLKVFCHVRGRLRDLDLTPERIARHFGISLRYLQVLFAELGTSPAKWIRDERLSRLRDDLADSRLDHLPVSTLGEKWGIVGASQVSRLFRVAFGLTPSNFRRLRDVLPMFANQAASLR